MIVKLADNIISPLGIGTEANYRAVKAGLSALKAYPATDLLPEGYYASLFRGLSGEPSLTEFESRCIACADPAIRDAGIDPASDRVLFIISTTKANVELLDTAGQNSPGHPLPPRTKPAQKTPSEAFSPAEAALRVSRHFGNPNTPLVVSNACISGLAAQIEALRSIESGRCDYAVVIGADVVGRFVISGFQSLKALSPEQCRPFDADRCGLNLGEAAACIVYGAKIPSSSSTPRDDREDTSRNNSVWCAVSGAICNDANHISGPSRTGEGSYRALMAAVGDDVKEDIAFINVHGTSTLYNDEMESIAIDRAGLADVPVNTLKGYFGHTLGAAGVLETILSMAAVEDGTVLGTRGFEHIGVSHQVRLNPENSPIEGGKQSFVKLLSGFGGVNAAMLFRRGEFKAAASPVQRELKAAHTVEISPEGALLDDEKLDIDAKGPALLEGIYRKFVGDWPKFFKMDPLARLGFVASELLLKAEGDQTMAGRSDRAVILFNRSGSLADDVNYQRGIDGPDHLGSPSLFVYTLPNIVTGEIAIRNKYFAETSFYCIPEPDEALMRSIVSEALEPGMSAIAGWCECSSENDFNAKMYILEG